MDRVRGAFLLTTYIALLPKGACDSADWVSNTTHYGCCHFRRMQECNSFGQFLHAIVDICYTCGIKSDGLVLNRQDFGAKGKKAVLSFAIPMVWCEPRDHTNDCYLSSCNLKGYNCRNKQNISYPDFPSERRPLPHGPDLPVPVPPTFFEANSSDEEHENSSGEDEDEYHPEKDSNEPLLFKQSELGE